MKILLIATLLALSVSCAQAADSPQSDTRHDFEARIEKLNAALAAKPDSTQLLSVRGDMQLFLGHFPEAVADYEKMIAIDPSLDAPHWRLGIAYHFNKQWEKSSQQFAKYHAYDGRDRENGIWKFFADARWHDLATARKEMLNYTEFDREPFPAIYDLLAGRMTEAQYQAYLDEKKVAENRTAIFFADYYRGLYQEWTNQPDKARASLKQAVERFTSAEAMAGGPGYMWQCARLHYELLKKTW